MPFYKILKLFPFLFLWTSVAFSQKYPVKNYTAATDLPNNSVRSLLIDSNNILWIGTDNGVVKKENDEYKYFFEEDGLALNKCWAIAEDINGKLWFGSYGAGISVYNGFEFEVISEEDGLVHNEITKLFSYRNHMYVGTSDGVSIIDVNTLEVLSFKVPEENELFRINGFFESRNEVYVVTYRSGVFKILKKGGDTALVKVNDHKFLYSVFVDNDSIYSSNKGFYTKTALEDFVTEEDSISREKFGSSILWDYVKSADDKIFAAAWGIYDTDGGIYELVDNQFILRSSEFNVSSKEVISLAYDPNFEKLYVGTKDAGLFEIALNPQIKFVEVEGKKILGFAKTKNTSALLLNDAIVITRAESETTIDVSQLKKWQESYVLNTRLPLPKHEDDFYELDYSIKAEDIYFYDVKVNRENYWINTNIGIFALKDSGELLHYLPVHSEEINFTAAGQLIGTNPYGGVKVFTDLEVLKYRHFKQEDPHTPTMIVGSLQIGEKTYFLSIFSGLYVWEDNRFTSYLEEGIWKESKLKHITELGENLAISNEFGDVFIVNDDSTFSIIEKIPRARFRGNTISFLKQFQGNLVIGTEKGLTLYKDQRFIFFDKEQGLEQPIWSAAVSEDRLSIGSKNGYYTLDPLVLTESEALVEQINIKDIFINNDKISLGLLLSSEELDLGYYENSILIRFSTNAHPYPNKLKYQYRLNKAEAWSMPSPKPELFLPYLQPEDYAIAVRVLDESTGLSFTQPVLNLEVHPPFWKTWWFALLTLSVLVIGVFGIYKFQLAQARKFEKQKRMIQKRFEETKMEALLAQMNPHFIFNAMNSIQYYILENDIDNATIFLGEFAKLIRLNLDHCTKQTIVLAEEIDYLLSYIRVENTRFNNSIKIVLELDPSIDTYEVEIPTMLLQSFIENVFVHAFPKSVSNPTLKISFKLKGAGILQCKIEDNGIGFSNRSKNKLHVSKGLTLVKERLALLGYDVEKSVMMESMKDRGTSVTLNLQI